MPPPDAGVSGCALPWRGDARLDFGHVAIDLCIPPELYERQSEPGCFILGKSRSMVEALVASVAGIAVANVVDVGVYKGGSLVLLNEVFRPRSSSSAARSASRYCRP